MARWTEQQVTELAPDDGSVDAARRLASPGPWSDTGSTDALVWGRCQGSGRTPYQVSVDVTGPAFRCSCPSRKLPCKHALALLLRWVSGSASVAHTDVAAPYAQEWADDRGRPAVERTNPPAPVDPAAQARRLEQRMTLMSAGMDEFAAWLTDLVRAGLAEARSQPYTWWDATAARLVDAQLPGLAEQVRTMASSVHRREDWVDHLLARAGRWWAATRAWAARDQLDPTELADLRVFLGWSQASADVRSGDQTTDRWLVLGLHRDEDGRVAAQRTWLRAESTGEMVQVLDFAAGDTVLAVPQLAGSVLSATLARYPGSSPRRALFASPPETAGRRTCLPVGGSLAAALDQGARQWATNPWSDRVPIVLDRVRVRTGEPGEPAYLVDPAGDRIALVADTELWALLALTGGEPTSVFGELDDGKFRPLSVAHDELVTPL